MRTLGLSAGHTNVAGKDRGATRAGINEGVEAVIFRDLVAQKLIHMGAKVIVDANSSATGSTVTAFSQKLKKTDIAIDIHFDSSVIETSTGTTVIIPEPSSLYEKGFGIGLSEMTSKVLGIKNRGVIPQTKTYYEASLGKKLAWMRLKCNRVIWELCFISNPSDWATYQANKERLASEASVYIFKYLMS